jgi:hypothetical protein
MNDVTKIEYGKGYTFFVEFDDDKKGDIDFSIYLENRPIFRPLKDIEFFKNAACN